jgi:CheY-like chemotaxis protein
LEPIGDSKPDELLAILVVEDEYFIARELSLALAESGARVLGPVAHMPHALRMVSLERIDAAVLDLNLRGDMAFAVADALASRRIPFVFATGYDSMVIPERHRHVPRWEKPYDARALSASLVRMAGQATHA